jgi:GAF domain-containing protein
MDLPELSASLDERLAAAAPDDRIGVAVGVLAGFFAVKPEEVAFFSFEPRFSDLQFLWPVPLRSAGSVPLAAQNSLVARTARFKKPVLNNAFATTPHLYIFETFRLDLTGGIPIQKIMSVPLLQDQQLKGVIQISRKAERAEAAGPDFTQADLGALAGLAAVIARHL